MSGPVALGQCASCHNPVGCLRRGFFPAQRTATSLRE
ncbi:cytochrome c3 family protein [Shinella pollutisoli]|uniref:Cytochrome c3 family protein n=1 Tax=Shinella pollutisoli TaxID=2250594 RepID=A0ABV7DLH9_9HYPH